MLNFEINTETEGEINEPTQDVHTVPTIIGIIFVGLLFGLYGMVYLVDGILPIPLYIRDEKGNPDAFIAERAHHDLKFLTDIGPRPTGSYENEVLAVEFLNNTLAAIQQNAHSIQKIETDLQIVSGSYDDWRFKAYSNIQNIVVKLHSESGSAHSLLVNVHFDSTSISPGGSDDGINCAVALEVLRKLSQSPKTLLHNIIFLFNGAEEVGLMASHGFITQHKWAKEVRAFINLESAGAGGKIMLFQVGPEQPWLLDYYSKVAHPNTQAVGEELFQNGFVPSDTDFRILRDFGNIVGLDFAFIKNGYRYHSRFDDFANIPLGSYQHVGGTMLSLIRNLGNAPELSEPEKQVKSNMVFYDFQGMFLIYYTETNAIIINVTVSALSITAALASFYSFRTGFPCRLFIYIMLTVAAILLSWITSAIFVKMLMSIIDGLEYSMSWYNNQWIIFGLYVSPIVACSCGIIILLRYLKCSMKVNLSLSGHTQIQAHIVRLIWTTLLLSGTFLGFRFVYLLLVPILFHTITFGIIQILCLHHSMRKWQIIYLLGTIIPTIFLMQQALTLITFIIPIMGRLGPYANTEKYIGILVLVSTILITSFYTPLITLTRKPLVVPASLFGVFLIFFIIMVTPLGFPFSGNLTSPAPQRFSVSHFLLINMDGTKMAGFKVGCGDYHCNSTIQQYVKDSNWDDRNWIQAEEPVIITEPIELQLHSKIHISDGLTRLNFTASGPSSMFINIWAEEGSTFTLLNLPSLFYSASLNSSAGLSIDYVWGKENSPLTILLDVKTPQNWNNSICKVTLIGSYQHSNNMVKSSQFTEFLNKFPNWTDVTYDVRVTRTWVY